MTPIETTTTGSCRSSELNRNEAVASDTRAIMPVKRSRKTDASEWVWDSICLPST